MKRILKKIFVNFEEVVGGTALMLMMLFVFFNTFGRIFFRRSFAAIDELAYLLFAYVIFVGSSSLFKHYGHGVIDLVVALLPRKVQAVISAGVSTLLVFICGLTLYLSFGYCGLAWTRVSQNLRIPQSFTAFAMVLGFFFMTIHAIFFLKNVITKQDYFHKIPIYDGIFIVDSVEDMVTENELHQAEEKEKTDAADKTGGASE